MGFNIMSRLSMALAALLFTYIAQLLFNGMDLRLANDYLVNPLIWLIFTVYLVSVSYLIEWIFKKINETSTWSYVSAYTVAGILIWAILFFPLVFDSASWYFFVIIFSSIYTVLGFVIFYIFKLVFRMNWRKVMMIGIPSLIALVFIVLTNPSIKSGFTSEYGDQNYQAEFENFNGEEPVWIPVEEGKEYEIEIDWDLVGDDTGGISISPEVHEMGELTVEEEEPLHFEASESGDLLFFYHGVNIEGSISFTWEEL